MSDYFSFKNAPDTLEHVFTAADPNADYSFYDLLIVRDTANGKVYGATDSGCSCPTPFEDHMFPTDFTELRSAQDLRDLAKDGPWVESDIEAAIKAAGF